MPKLTLFYNTLMRMALDCRNKSTYKTMFLTCDFIYWQLRVGLYRHEAGLDSYSTVIGIIDDIKPQEAEQLSLLIDGIRVLYSDLIGYPLECHCKSQNESCPTCRWADYLLNVVEAEPAPVDLTYLNYHILS